MHDSSLQSPALKNQYLTTITRVMYRNIDGVSRQSILKNCNEGDALILKRNPDHLHDKNSICLCTIDHQQVGYVSSDYALAQHLDKGGKALAMIVALSGGQNFVQKILGLKGKPYSARIQITRLPLASEVIPFESTQIETMASPVEKKAYANP